MLDYLPLVLAVLGPVGAIASFLVPLTHDYPRLQGVLRVLAAFGLDAKKVGSGSVQAMTGEKDLYVLSPPKDGPK